MTRTCWRVGRTYAADGREPGKQARCREVLRSLSGENVGVVSTQVLQELFVVLTRKLKVEPRAAKPIVQAVREQWEVVVITPPLIEAAIDIVVQNQLSFWDSLILVAAESAGCETLWSEDMQDGQVVGRVKIVNPINH